MPLMFETSSIASWRRGSRRSTSWSRSARTTPMDDAQLSALVGRPVVERPRRPPPDLQSSLGRPGDVRDARHDSGRGDCRAHRAADCEQDVPVALNRLVDRVRPRPHLRAGVSRTRWSASRAARSICFPGIAAPEIIHFTHWLGALITSYE